MTWNTGLIADSQQQEQTAMAGQGLNLGETAFRVALGGDGLSRSDLPQLSMEQESQFGKAMAQAGGSYQFPVRQSDDGRSAQRVFAKRDSENTVKLATANAQLDSSGRQTGSVRPQTATFSRENMSPGAEQQLLPPMATPEASVAAGKRRMSSPDEQSDAAVKRPRTEATAPQTEPSGAGPASPYTAAPGAPGASGASATGMGPPTLPTHRDTILEASGGQAANLQTPRSEIASRIAREHPELKRNTINATLSAGDIGTTRRIGAEPTQNSEIRAWADAKISSNPEMSRPELAKEIYKEHPDINLNSIRGVIDNAKLGAAAPAREKWTDGEKTQLQSFAAPLKAQGMTSKEIAERFDQAGFSNRPIGGIASQIDKLS